MRMLVAAAALAVLCGPALAVPPATQPPATPPILGAGLPAAGSGVSGQLFVDATTHALWLNVAGVWTQVGIFAAPTAGDVGPVATPGPYLAAAGGGFLLTSGGGRILLR